jgi:hypothetical protein
MSRWFLMLPLGILATSFAIAPYVTPVRSLTGAVAPSVTTPQLLYRHDGTDFFYTSADVLHPDRFGLPGQYFEAVVFDVWASGEGVTHVGEQLTWIVLIWNSIKGPGDWGRADFDLAESFRSSMGGPPRIPRGEALSFELPSSSTYRRQSGLRQLVALAIRNPDPLPSGSNTPPLFPQALRQAFATLRDRGVRSVAVPRMTAQATIGEKGSRASSWKVILQETDVAARAARIRRVAFGGWSTDGLTDAAFRTAWASRRTELLSESATIAHEQLRLAAIIAAAALLRWHLRGRMLRWQHVLALAVLAPPTAFSITGAGRWLTSAITPGAVGVFVTECLVAIAAGWTIERIVRFDPKKVIEEDPVEKHVAPDPPLPY